MKLPSFLGLYVNQWMEFSFRYHIGRTKILRKRAIASMIDKTYKKEAQPLWSGSDNNRIAANCRQ